METPADTPHRNPAPAPGKGGDASSVDMRELQAIAAAPEIDFARMSADARIQYFRGRVPDFGARVEQGFAAAVEGVPSDDPVRANVLRAFQLRVEDHLSVPGGGHGGGALDHMNESGHRQISGEQYHRLQVAAVAVAASVIEAGGHPDFAQGAYARLGKMVAPDWTGRA